MTPSDEPLQEESGPEDTDILFFFCPYAGHPPPHRFDINLGAAYLAAYLKQKGIRSAFFFGRYDNDPAFGQMLADVEAVKPRTIGFSVYGSNLPETAALCRAIKKNHPEVPIIWGGPEIRFKPEKIIETYGKAVDVCVAGEGEKPLTRLLGQNPPWSDDFLKHIPGVNFMGRKSGRIINNPSGSTLLQDHPAPPSARQALDIYPSPYLNGIVPDAYFHDKSVVSILTSRGCPFKCVYCQFSALNDHMVHFHSVDRVMAEIEWIYQKVLCYHPHKQEIMLMIFDEALTLSRKRIEVLCHRLIAKGFRPPLRLWIETRADYVDADLVALLKKAGVKKIGFGLESAVPRVLKKIRKVSAGSGPSPKSVEAEIRFLQRIQKAVKWSKDQGLFTSVSIIVGLPTETMEDARKSLRFVKKLEVDVYYHNFLNVLEGTQLEKMARDLGYQWDLYYEGYTGKYGHRYTRAPFDTRTLQPLSNAMVFQRDRNRFSVLFRGWSCALKLAPPHGRSLYYRPFLLWFEASPTGTNPSHAFLRRFAGLSTTLFFPDDSALSDEFLSAILMRLPLKNARVHRVPGKGSALKRIMGIQEADHSTPFFLSFKNLEGFQAGDVGRRIFATLDDADDVKDWIRFLTVLKAENNGPLTYEQAELLPFDLFEACRWFSWQASGCPAGLMTHAFCDTRKGLRPCRHFTPLRRVDEDTPLSVFKKEVNAHIRQKQEQRGCNACPVRLKCPQCVAPYPLTDAQYCNFQSDYWS